MSDFKASYLSGIRSDIYWNVASFGVLAISGVLLNVLIAREYGPAGLGFFSLVLAIYFVISQFACGGLMFSTLSFSAQEKADRGRVASLIWSAAILAATLAALVLGATYCLGQAIASIYSDPEIMTGLLWSFPGLWCFSLNKVFLFAANGLGYMRMYAIGQAYRYVALILSLCGCIYLEVPYQKLPLILSISEGSLLLIMGSFITYHFPPSLRSDMGGWFRRHIDFSLKAFFCGLLVESHAKIDLIMLGMFTSKQVVGLYAFASMIAEGIYQIVIVMQAIITPRFSPLRDPAIAKVELPKLIRSLYRYLCPALLLIAAVGAALFPWFATLMTGDVAFASGWIYFLVLVSGTAISSGYVVVSIALNQWGYPGLYLLFLVSSVITNILLNFALIPIFGGLGAALATASAFCLSIVFFKVIARYGMKAQF